MNDVKLMMLRAPHIPAIPTAWIHPATRCREYLIEFTSATTNGQSCKPDPEASCTLESPPVSYNLEVLKIHVPKNQKVKPSGAFHTLPVNSSRSDYTNLNYSELSAS